MSARRAWVFRLMMALGLLVGVGLAASWVADRFADEAAVDPDAPRAVWVTHRWVGQAPDAGTVGEFADRLAGAGVTDVFVHVGPLDATGRVAPGVSPYARAFAEALRSHLPDLRVQAWLGQAEARGGGKLDLREAAVRQRTVRTAARFMHEGYDGIHYDIEPIWDGDAHFLALLEDTAAMLDTEGGILSVAAEELPLLPDAERWLTAVVRRYHPWTVSYHREVARHADQIAVMTYDSAMPLEHLYRRFVARHARVLGPALPEETQLLLGVPSYEEWNAGHWPAETIDNALAGLRRGLATVGSDERARIGWALYADWHTDADEWSRVR